MRIPWCQSGEYGACCNISDFKSWICFTERLAMISGLVVLQTHTRRQQLAGFSSNFIPPELSFFTVFLCTRFTNYDSDLSIFVWITFVFYQECELYIIYNLTNDCTIISNTIITNNMLLHVSTFKMSSSGSSL